MSTPDYYAYNGGRMTEEQRKNLDAWRAAWVAELRSGKYVQGRGMLCGNGKHCCLGVLAEIAVAAGYFEKYHGGRFGTPDGAFSRTSLPGFCGALIEPIRNANGLFYLNDFLGYTFDQIADVIESRNVMLDNGAIL